jgi:hypothetical protein
VMATPITLANATVRVNIVEIKVTILNIFINQIRHFQLLKA